MAEFGSSSVTGPRPQNEDAFLTVDLTPHSEKLGGLRALLVVADGMGGHANGQLASRCAIDAAQEYAQKLVEGVVKGTDLVPEPYHILWDIIGAANAAVLRASREQGGTRMGSTIVAALVGQGRAWVAHVGDSRAYHVRPTSVKRVTTDHSRVARLVAEGVISERQALDHPQRSVVERALGFEGAFPDFGKVWLEPEDILMLATDGLFTAVDPAQILAVTASADSVEAAAAQLTGAAVRRGTQDNTTVVLWAGDWAAFQAALDTPMPNSTSGRTPRQALAKISTAVPAERRGWARYAYLAGLAVIVAAAVVVAVTTTRGGVTNGGGGTGDISTVSTSIGSTSISSSSSTLAGPTSTSLIVTSTVPTVPGPGAVTIQVRSGGAYVRVGPGTGYKTCGALKGKVQLSARLAPGKQWYEIATSDLTQADLQAGSSLQKVLNAAQSGFVYVGAGVVKVIPGSTTSTSG